MQEAPNTCIQPSGFDSLRSARLRLMRQPLDPILAQQGKRKKSSRLWGDEHLVNKFSVIM